MWHGKQISTTYLANKYILAEDIILADSRDSSIGRDHGDPKDEFGESCFITNTATESLSLPRSSINYDVCLEFPICLLYKLIVFLLMIFRCSEESCSSIAGHFHQW